MAKSLNAWPILSRHTFHTPSNSGGDFQYRGQSWKLTAFNSFSCAVGNAGWSLVPATVHLTMTDSPKKASVASLTAKVLNLDSQWSFGYEDKTLLMGISLADSISQAGRACVVADGGLYGSGLGDSSVCGVIGDLGELAGGNSCKSDTNVVNDDVARWLGRVTGAGKVEERTGTLDDGAGELSVVR